MKKNSNIILKKIQISSQIIRIQFISSEPIFAWLENTIKFYPDIFSLEIANDILIIDYYKLTKKFESKKRSILFKLSISNSIQKLSYDFTEQFVLEITKSSLPIKINEKNELIFELELNEEDTNKKSTDDELDNFFIEMEKCRRVVKRFKKEGLPAKILVIGTCFSRSVFRSDNYFNPDYKKYFSVVYTAFHNSIISLMTEPIKDSDYTKTKDLLGSDVYKYIEIEFKKKYF